MSPSPEKDRLLEHQYDEIQEYDNPLPGWWSLLLWATIVWAVIYFFNFIPGVGTGQGRIANYERDSTAAADKYGAVQQQQQQPIDEAAVLAAVADPAKVAAGKQVFTATCAPCHLVDGGGTIGPNLTDDYWIHGPRPIDIATTVTNGVLEKGMPVWGPVLGPEKIANVAAYVYTLHGTHPAVPKAPQGTKYSYDANGPVVTGTDSTAAAQ